MSEELELEIITDDVAIPPAANAIGPVAHHQPRQNYSGVETDDDFIYEFLKSRNSPRTRELYARSIKEFRLFYTGPLRDLNRKQMQDFVDGIKSRGLKPNTVLAKVAPVKSMYTWGMESGYLPMNIPSMVKLPKPSSIIEEKVLSERDCQKIFAALEKNNRTHWLIIYAVYATGARVTEFTLLQVRNFQKNPEGGHYVIFDGATTKSKKTRRIGLPDWLAEEISEHIARHEKEGDDFIFTYRRNQVNRHYQRQGVYSMLDRVCKRNGLPRCTPHMLRHSIATHAIQRGTPIQKVSYKLGHSGVNITAQTYDHSDKTEGFESGLL